MTAFCHLAALVSVSLATGQDPVVPPKQEAKKDFNPAAVGSLVPEKLGAELKLTNEQRKQVDALEQEFHKQRKAALTITMMKVQTILDKIEREEEPAPALAVTALITNTMLDLSRTKGTYEKKVSETLTPDQQRVFAAWQKLKPKDKKEPTPEMQELFRELEHWIDGPEWQAKDNHESTKKGDKK